jgi:osmotically-inducible protein OsmY
VSDLSAFDWDAGMHVLVDPSADLLARMFAAGYLPVAQAKVADGAYDLSNTRAAAYARARAAELVAGVDGVTHDQVTTMLRDLLGTGLEDASVSQADIAAAIEDLFAGMTGERAGTIARTELGFAGNRGTIGAGRDTGAIAARVSDGTESDQECQDADGQLWTLDQADENALEHPNCGRSFEMVYADELSDAELADIGDQ